MTAPSPWRRLLAVLVAGAALTVFVSACGDDSGSSSGDSADATESASGTSPEEVIVPDATVTAGLNESIKAMHDLADGVANGTATDAQFEAMHEGWASYEGTVKKNNPEAYLGMEDALAAMQKAISDKDAAAAKQAATDFENDATAYLAEHP
jgi:hypothetical protein